MTGLTRKAMERLTALTQRAAAALVLAAALHAPWTAAPACAAPQGRLNLNVQVDGISLVTDLTAAPGSLTGTVDLTWTEPYRQGTAAPHVYELKASTSAQIDTVAQLVAAAPLSAHSPTVVPAPGPGGGASGMVVTGLLPGVTYYFAVREVDAGAPQLAGFWRRGGTGNANLNNVAVAKFTPNDPNAVTDLVAASSGPVANPFALLSWTAPLNANGVPIDRYILRASTVSAASLGNAEAWFAQASTSAVVPAVKAPGQVETYVLTGLETGVPHYFGIKAIDKQTEISPIDTKAGGLATQAQLTLIATINVAASSGPVSGSVNLSWTEPSLSGFTPPARYVVRVSSTANFADTAGFDAAQPLSALSPSQPPDPGGGGGIVNFLVTGLSPAVTYYFGVREMDDFGNDTDWLRSVPLNLSVNNFAAAAYSPNPPDPITDLTALTGSVEGQVSLSWTAPRNQNFAPMASYTVKYATFSAASLGGDTTAWFDAAASSHVVGALAPGSQVSLSLHGLFPLSTFYFGVRSADVFNEVSPIDTAASGGSQASAPPKNDPPGTPGGLAAVPGLRRLTVSWTDMSPAQRTLGFSHYRLYRSTQPATDFVLVATTTATSYLDRPLPALVTYYYRVDGTEGPGGLDGVASSTAGATPFTLVPQDPFGFVVDASSSAVAFTWTPTLRFSDGTPFDSTGTPASDELLGYQILRSTEVCTPAFNWLSSATVAVTTFTDVTNGDSLFYQIRSFNALGRSSGTLVLSALGDHHYFADDCSSEIAIDGPTAFALKASSSGLGGDIMLARGRRPDLVGGEVLQAVEFRPLLNGVTELKGFFLPKPARVVLHYQTGSGGAPEPDTSPLGAASSFSPSGSGAAALPAENLGAYWHNGREFKKVYGRVDTLAQTVSLESPNLGLYEVRALARSSSLVFDLSNISGRVITPNGDGRNDQVIFAYDPGPRNVRPEGSIYDVRGSFVARMVPGLVPNTLVWDGRMNGVPVTSGVYVYRMTGDGKAFSGTIVVAR